MDFFILPAEKIKMKKINISGKLSTGFPRRFNSPLIRQICFNFFLFYETGFYIMKSILRIINHCLIVDRPDDEYLLSKAPRSGFLPL